MLIPNERKRNCILKIAHVAVIAYLNRFLGERTFYSNVGWSFFPKELECADELAVCTGWL